jgi:hypothetical protein
MTRGWGRTLLGLAVATIGLGIVLATGVFSAGTVVAVYLVVVAALVLAPLTRLAREESEARASLFEQALRRPEAVTLRPSELVRIERELVVGMETAGGLDMRLVPLLREAAVARLSVKRHLDLVRRPDAAHAVLGDEAWELVRPDRPAPVERHAPGIDLPRLRRLLDTLESI